MPLKIIRQDITKIECDAIVNPTNCEMIPGGGTDAAIHEAAGAELLEYCKGLGGCPVGEARITPAFGLPCKYVIHTVGPEWTGGLSGERVLLTSCYHEAMKLAISHGCESVAFPLISSGTYGYPKDRVLKAAVEVISFYLSRVEMEVYIVVYDKTSYTVSRELFNDVQSYIDSYYAESRLERAERLLDEGICRRRTERRERSTEPLRALSFDEDRSDTVSAEECCESLDSMLRAMDKGFAQTLFYYIDKKGLSDVECYKRSNVGKKTFSKIKCNKDYRPSKVTAVSFAIGLRLDIEETRHLLATAGMCLSRSSKFDVIIEYFITSGRYETVFDVNEVLYQFDQSLLGV